MNRAIATPLILGGHSFISQQGNDPATSPEEQRVIVESCLDHGIRWFDTTYQPERVALGNVLDALGRRGEATILAWNFFTDFAPGDPVGEAEYYRPGHIEIILEQLRTDYVDCLVVVPLADPGENQRQVELTTEWRKKGYVRSLGLWIENPAIIEPATPFAPKAELGARFASRSDRSTSPWTTPHPPSPPARGPDGRPSPPRRFFADGNWTG